MNIASEFSRSREATSEAYLDIAKLLAANNFGDVNYFVVTYKWYDHCNVSANYILQGSPKIKAHQNSLWKVVSSDFLDYLALLYGHVYRVACYDKCCRRNYIHNKDILTIHHNIIADRLRLMLCDVMLPVVDVCAYIKRLLHAIIRRPRLLK